MEVLTKVEDSNKLEVKSKKWKRIEWIDWLKAIGIFLVSLGHSNCVPKLRKYIYSFHMPLFFILGGATFRPEKYEGVIECVKDKAKKLLLPYLCINLFTIPFWYIYCKYMSNRIFNIYDIIKGIFIGNDDIVLLINRTNMVHTYFVFRRSIILYIV